MKYWHKLFIATLALFLLALNVGAFILADTTYRTSLTTERDRAFSEHRIIANAFSKDILSITARDALTLSVISSLFRSYAEYYYPQGLFLALRDSDGKLYQNLPMLPGFPDHQANQQVAVVAEHERTMYLFVEGELGNGFSLIIGRSIADTQQRAEQIKKTMVISSVGIAIALSLALMFTLKRLTHPINALSKSASGIAHGAYDVRVHIKRGDEIGELADSFNQMACEVQEHITALQDSADRRQQFIDNLAHEMRTPLTAIGGYAEYLLSAAVTEDDRVDSLQYILHESKRLSEISEKLLWLTKVREGNLELRSIALCGMFNQVSATLQSDIERQQIMFHIESTEIAWFSDETLLYMLLLNLVKNALRACMPGGNVWIAATAESIQVRDDGIGIAEQEFSRITEPFYRVDKARDRLAGGAGLGLAISNRIADRLGLEMRFESMHGYGTTVTLLQVDNDLIESP